MISNNTTDTATASNSADTPNYSASHQKAQPLPCWEFYKNTRLTVAHWHYLVKKRGLPLDFVMDNCESMTANTAKGYLGYKPPSNGIMIRGENGQLQFRPDNPKVVEENGVKKGAKYLTPKDDMGYDAMRLTHPMYPDYWTNLEALKERAYKIDGVPCIAVTEGGFKAMVVMDNGIPCVALLGVEMGLTPRKNDPQGKRYLVHALEKFAKAKFGFVMMFDGDTATNINVTNALKKLGHQLGLFNSPVHVASWNMTSEKDKGVDDYILNCGFPQFQSEVLSKVQSFTDWLIKVDQEFKDNGINADDLPQKIGKLGAQRAQLKLVVNNRLRHNELTNEIELDGVSIGSDDFKLELDETFGLELKCTERDLKAIVIKTAKENGYHPVREYLSQCNETHSDTSILNGFAKRYFGVSNPLYETFVRKFLIGAVARVFKPGCKLDTMLVLQGGQGIGKSTFFKTLAIKDKWFCDNISIKDKDKDELLKLHQTWIVEIAELDYTFSKADTGKTKSFLSTSSDKLRTPYAAKTESMSRMCAMAGTTNSSEILRDPTGSRRFQIIPVVKTIPTDLLEKECDAIWGAAVQAYENGESWWLTRDEQKQSNDNNEPYSNDSPWLDDIENYLEGKISVITDELLDLLGVSKDNLGQTKTAQREIADIMLKLKWVKTENLKDDNGKRRRGYKRPVVTVPDTEPDTQPPYTAPPSCVDSCVNSNLDTEGDTQHTRPTQQNCQTSENVKSEPVPPPKPEGFKVGDRVIQVTRQTVDGYKLYGSVVDVEEPRRDGLGGIYKVRWDNASVSGLMKSVSECEIEPYQA